MKLILATILATVACTAFADSRHPEGSSKGKAPTTFDATLNSSENKLIVKRNGVIYQIIQLESIPLDGNQVSVLDFNFDGISDISISGDQGNVERFADIYLYSKKTRKFERSEQLSSIPCLVVDSTKNELRGECFHASSCENWTEIYRLRNHDTLTLVEKQGFGCDPASGATFRYVEKYRNGRLTSNSVVDVK